MKEVANFFWYGNNMSRYEFLSLTSFLKNNFEVRVWCYDEITVPSEVKLMDANLILPKEDLFIYEQGGKPNNLAAFSDVFRFTLLSKNLGEWWFDTDCVCLRDASEFYKLKENKNFIVGWEDENYVNGACLSFVNEKTSLDILKTQKEILTSKKNLIWGEIGPRLLTDYIKKEKLESQILNKSFFYPIHYTQVNQMNDLNFCEEFKKLSENSYVCHLWNEILSNTINKNLQPNENSFLDFLFIKYNLI